MIISLVLVLLCWLFLRQAGVHSGSIRWHFFFLGAGFLLLEAQIVSKMALLFGTTWVVNSIVIAGLLLLIVASNLLVDLVPRIPFSLAYAGIFATILFSYFIPLDKLFFPSLAAKMLAATLVLCLPVFFAGIVFIKSFAVDLFSGQMLGSNLFGAWWADSSSLFRIGRASDSFSSSSLSSISLLCFRFAPLRPRRINRNERRSR